ncbi:MAG: hypothetical protein SPL13_01625 [Clostridia bacterium]|nr:hypothetical protein [Clostridia bacterium]
MEILRFLLSVLSGADNNGESGSSNNPISDVLNGNFDLRSFLNSINPESLIPLIKTFLNGDEKSPSDVSEGLSPIAGVADKDIIYALNGYFAEV